MKLQDKIMGDPALGWRERYQAHGTEEASPDVPDATGLELIAQRVRERRRRGGRRRHVYYREQATLEVAPAACATSSRTCAPTTTSPGRA